MPKARAKASGQSQPEQPSRRVEYLPLSEVVGNEHNPKAHALDTLDASVGRFGFVEPIVVDGRTGLVISGHGRSKTLAAMEARGDSAPDGVQTGPDGRWLVPVVTGWSSRTDTEANAALIALNRTTELGGWVDEELLGLLETLGDSPYGFDGVGYDEQSIEDLRAYLSSKDLAESWDTEDGLDDDDIADISGTLSGEPTVALNIVVNEKDRTRFYQDMQDLGYVLEVRDARR